MITVGALMVACDDETYLSGMSCQAMTVFGGYLPCLCQGFRRKFFQLVPVHFVTSERKHLATESEEPDAESLVPSQHLGNVPCICQSEALNIRLASSDIGWLIFIRPILGRMVGHIRVF